MYASLWAGNWQILWGLLLFPINFIPLPSPAPHYAPAEMGSYLNKTFVCFLGTVRKQLEPLRRAMTLHQLTAASPLAVCASCHTLQAPTNSTGDSACASPGGSAAVWFCAYLLFNVSFNVLLLWLTKRMSATWATIATVLCLDLTSLFSMSRALMGDEAHPVTLEQYLGLVIAALAMWVYNLQPERDADGRNVEGAHAFESRPPTMASVAHDRASFTGRSSFTAGGGRRSSQGCRSMSHHGTDDSISGIAE